MITAKAIATLNFVILVGLSAGNAHAQDTQDTQDAPLPQDVAKPPPHPNHKAPASAAEAATDPSAILAQLGFQYWTTIPEGNDTLGDTFLIQPVLPLTKNNVLRPALAVVGTPGANRETGIGDLLLLDVFIFQAKNTT